MACDVVEQGVYLCSSALACLVNKGYTSKDGMFVSLWCC